MSPLFLTSTLIIYERSASRHGRFTASEVAVCTHWIGCWMWLFGQYGEEKILLISEIEPRLLSRPPHSLLL
jgi:hypothetical protein